MDNRQVGNVSPKHCVGDSRLDPVGGRKWENRLNRCDLPDIRSPTSHFLIDQNRPKSILVDQKMSF
ncbi:MAG: hypothetical protein LBF88_13525 [Planctomycetaceae bacterium]|nr:hypothetical protein [Planctomycetaceae bacterium]